MALTEKLDSRSIGALDGARTTAFVTADTGTVQSWRINGRSGTVKAGPIYRVNRLTCRDLAHLVELPDGELKTRETFCKTNESDWQVLAAL